jgi:CRP-like cAMP-binding protein
MEDSERLGHLLECLIKVIGRVAITVDKVSEIVSASPKLIKAFNLCDGTATQLEIAKKCGLDPGNFNRAIGRWVANGVAFWIGSGKDARLLHIYPIPEPSRKNAKKR